MVRRPATTPLTQNAHIWVDYRGMAYKLSCLLGEARRQCGQLSGALNMRLSLLSIVLVALLGLCYLEQASAKAGEFILVTFQFKLIFFMVLIVCSGSNCDPIGLAIPPLKPAIGVSTAKNYDHSLYQVYAGRNCDCIYGYKLRSTLSLLEGLNGQLQGR